MFSITLMSLVIGIVFNVGKADECNTPNNERAQCISLYSCSVLLNAASDPTKREFVRQSNCGGSVMEPMVCCGSQSNFTTPKENRKYLNLQALLPDRRICGRQHSDDYFSSLNGTTITEFPWLALISFKVVINPIAKSHFYCDGSLINKKYVLTAGHCLNDPNYEPINVRLGEYHTGNETDCVKDGLVIECIDGILDFGVEKIISHPEHGKNNPVPDKRAIVWKHDIGLIRINGSVEYTDYIRPICLPLPGSKAPEIGDRLVTSGFGNYIFTQTPIIKKGKYSNLTTNQECEQIYLEINYTVSLKDSYICGSQFDNNEPTCVSDSGSPVMFFHKLQWQQEGIATSGLCTGGYPGIYTNVKYYLGWIEESLEP